MASDPNAPVTGNVRSTTINENPAKVLEDITQIKDDEIIIIRKMMDIVSWTLFDIATKEAKTPLRIQYVNGYLIESFNWFGIHGLRTFFENREIVLPKLGIIKIIDHSLERPRADELNRPDDLLYPHEARDRITY